MNASLIVRRMMPSILCVLLGAPTPLRAAARNDDPCAAKLQAIAGAIDNYRLVHGKAPGKLSDLYYQGFVERLSDFVCPDSAGRQIFPRWELDAKSDYTLEPVAGVANVVVREKAPRRPDGQILAAFADGSVRPVPIGSTGRTVDLPELAESDRLFRAGKYREALAAAEAALRKSPDHAAALKMRAGGKLWTNDLAGARADFARLAQVQNDVESRRLRATMELVAGDPRLARSEAEALLRVNPNDSSILTLHGQACLWTADNAAAAASFARAIQVQPACAQLIYDQAAQFQQAGVPLVANLLYTTVLHLNPQMTGAYYGLGVANARLGYNERAIQAFEMFLRYDQTSEYARYAQQELTRLRSQGQQQGSR